MGSGRRDGHTETETEIGRESVVGGRGRHTETETELGTEIGIEAEIGIGAQRLRQR